MFAIIFLPKSFANLLGQSVVCGSQTEKHSIRESVSFDGKEPKPDYTHISDVTADPLTEAIFHCVCHHQAYKHARIRNNLFIYLYHVFSDYH
jgi:hypothetical protein